MNKLEEIHVKSFDIINPFSHYDLKRECQKAKSNSLMAQKSAEITTDVAVKFLSWCNEPIYRYHSELNFRPRAIAQFPDNKEYIIIDETGYSIFPKGKFLTEEELFNYFINNVYEK